MTRRLVGFGVNPGMMDGPSCYYRVHQAARVIATRDVADVIVAGRCGVPDTPGPLALEPLNQPGQLVVPDSVIFHYTSVTAPAIERARATGQRVYLDLDDDIWAVPDYNTFAAKVRSDAAKLGPVMRAVTAVLCSTPTLARVCAENTGARTIVAPNIFDPERYPSRRPFATDQPVIGWHGLCRTSGDDIRLIGELVAPILAAHPEVMFMHVGCEEPDDFADMSGLPTDRIISRPGVPIVELPWALDFTIGLVVRANNGFNRSRTSTKGFELAASGTPVVACTDMESYADTPFLVDADSFANRIEELLDLDARITASEQASAWAWELAEANAAAWPTLEVCGTIAGLATVGAGR